MGYANTSKTVIKYLIFTLKNQKSKRKKIELNLKIEKNKKLNSSPISK